MGIMSEKRISSKGRRLDRSLPKFNKYAIFLGVLPGLLIFILVNVIPSLGTFGLSFTDIKQVPGYEWQFLGLDNYREILFQSNSRDIQEAMRRTFVFTGLVTVLQISLALVMAVLLNLKFVRGKNLYRGIIYLPIMLGVTVCGLTFKLFFSIDGPVQAVLKLLGTSSAFWGDWNLAIYLLVFCQMWYCVGSTMVIFLAALQNVSLDMEEAARVDGANAWQIFWRITIPQIIPTIFVNLLMCVIGNLNEYQIIMVTTGASRQTTTLAMMVYSLAFSLDSTHPNAGRQGYASALQILIFFLVLIFTLILRYIQNRVEED